MSLEQSLRLLLLLHYGNIRDSTDHAPRVLYKAISQKSGSKEGIRAKIVCCANKIGAQNDISPMTEKDIKLCLKNHNSSYTNFRHFQLNRQGRLNPDFGFKNRELQIIHVLTLALLKMNEITMKERKIGWHSSMTKIPESEMTDELRALWKRLNDENVGNA